MSVCEWESQEARYLLKRVCEVTIRFRTDHAQCSRILVRIDDNCVSAKSDVLLIITIFKYMRS